MNRLQTITLVFLFLLTVLNTYAQEATFDETEAWLNEKLNENFVNWDSRSSQFTSEYKATIKDCSCTMIVKRTLNNKPTYDYTQYKFNVRDVVETSVVHKEDNSSKFAMLILHGKDQKIIDQVILATENGKQIERTLETSVDIKFATNELTQRVQKAFDYYIKLCKEKKEKF